VSRGAKLHELRVVYEQRGAPGRRMLSSRDVHSFLLGAVPSLAYQTDESFFVLALDARHRIVAWSELFRGPMTACPVDPASVFRWALMSGAVSIVIAHSHPSGCPQASPEDVALTRRLVDAGRIIGIEILDHVIVGDATSYFSFLDAGFLSKPEPEGGA